MSFLLYRPADDAVFDDFSKISDHFPKTFPKIFQNCSDVFPKIAEDDPNMFRSHTNILKCSKMDKREMLSKMISSRDISSHERISDRFYQFVTTRYTTDFYIIKCDITGCDVNPKQV